MWHERLWLKLWARGDCNCASPLSKIAQLQSPRDHSFNPETRMKAVYICFIYAIHIFIVYWLVKRFLEKLRNFIVNYKHDNVDCFLIDVLSMFNARKTARYSASFVCCTQTHHHRAVYLRAWKDYLRVEKDYLRVEKTIYGLKKTIYGFDLVSAE